MGRTRIGTLQAAREMGVMKQKQSSGAEAFETGSSYAEVLQSNLIHGDQAFFPVYQPDAEALHAKYRAVAQGARASHYDAAKEVRARGAGAYQFSLDEESRAEQMASLGAQRAETESIRQAGVERGELSAAQQLRKRKLEERKALVDAKRAKLLGGEKEVERMRDGRRAAETDLFLKGLEKELNAKTME